MSTEYNKTNAGRLFDRAQELVTGHEWLGEFGLEEHNKAIVRRLVEEGLNQGNVAVYDQLCAPIFIFHDPDRPDVRTLEDLKRFVTETRSAFPDLHFTIEDLFASRAFSDPTIEDMFAKGMQVAERWTMSGTNTGDLVTPTMHIPATGRQVTMTGIAIFRFADGKFVDEWHLADYLGMFQQLGLIPVP